MYLLSSQPHPFVSGLSTSSKYEEFLNAEWKPNYERGCSYYFGYKAIRRFLDENDLLCLVRAHQVCEQPEQAYIPVTLASVVLTGPWGMDKFSSVEETGLQPT